MKSGFVSDQSLSWYRYLGQVTVSRTPANHRRVETSVCERMIMSEHSKNLPYVIITPARNEEQFIEKTIQSMIRQSVLPIKWVIVNDGSTDRTGEIEAAVRMHKEFYGISKFFFNKGDKGIYFCMCFMHI